MALSTQVTLTDNFGEVIEFTGVYVKVEQVLSDKNVSSANYCIYRSQGGPLLQDRSIQFATDLNGKNLIKQAYLHLKALPEFADAVDC